MKIRSPVPEDRVKLQAMLYDVGIFNAQEIDVAMELIDIVLKDPAQKDYHIYCMVDERDEPIGYVCYGQAPMTQGTYDLYWIVVHPGFQGKGIGSKLMDFLERIVREEEGRMILVETSSTPDYGKTLSFYSGKGYREVARVPDYYHPGNDRITFWKRFTRSTARSPAFESGEGGAAQGEP